MFRGEWVNPLGWVGPQASLMGDFCSQHCYGILGRALARGLQEKHFQQ